MEGTGTGATAMLVGTPGDVGERPDAATITLAREEIEEALASDAPLDLILSVQSAGGEPQGPVVQVDVTDNGPGMPADVVDKIFSPFFTTKPQGSGLGLAIVRKIVDAHDGRIDVSSSSAGTRFRVTLPVSSPTGWFK